MNTHSPVTATTSAYRVDTSNDRRPKHAPSRDQEGASSASWSLEVVRLEDIRLHEEHDPTRADPLVRAFIRDGVQRHPVILARDLQGPLIHLDGANRITAAKRLDCRHIAAQVVNYADPDAVILDTWLHLTRLNPRALEEAASEWANCKLMALSPERALEMIAQGRAAATAIFANGEAFALMSGMGLADRVEAMRQLTRLYAKHTQREIPPDGDLLMGINELLNRNPLTNVCIAFTRLSKADVITLAWNMGTRLPAGITRHLIACGRMLNVDAPLSLLRADLPAEEKTIRLRERLAKRRRRTYMEPTIVYETY